jgi:hypothetical protein
VNYFGGKIVGDEISIPLVVVFLVWIINLCTCVKPHPFFGFILAFLCFLGGGIFIASGIIFDMFATPSSFILCCMATGFIFLLIIGIGLMLFKKSMYLKKLSKRPQIKEAADEVRKIICETINQETDGDTLIKFVTKSSTIDYWILRLMANGLSCAIRNKLFEIICTKDTLNISQIDNACNNENIAVKVTLGKKTMNTTLSVESYRKYLEWRGKPDIDNSQE